MKSNLVAHIFFKYIFLVLGLVTLGLATGLFVISETSLMNVDLSSLEMIAAAPLCFVGLLFILFYLVSQTNFAFVEFKNQSIVIKKESEVKTYSWMDVESISRIPFIQPPIYSMSVKGMEEEIWFNTDAPLNSAFSLYANVGQMGEFIAERKRHMQIYPKMHVQLAR